LTGLGKDKLSFENNTHKFAKQHLDVPSLTVKIFCGQIKLKLSWLEKKQQHCGEKKRHRTAVEGPRWIYAAFMHRV